MFAGLTWHFGQVWFLPAMLVAAAGVLALGIIDLETMTLPKSMVWIHLAMVAALLMMATIATGSWRKLIVGVICALLWSGLYFVMHLASPKSIGFGDVRFALVLGLSLGYLDLSYPALAFVISNVVGLAISVTLIATKRMKKDRPVPYGVFLAIGTIIVLFLGSEIASPLRSPQDWFR
jgi:leader peptidase (prepilin peptidase)/N-methyltransferase